MPGWRASADGPLLRSLSLQAGNFTGNSAKSDRNRLIAPGGREVELSSAESGLLETMLKRPNRILSRTDLLGSHAEECFDRSIDARISRLRRKLTDNDDAPELIKTVYGAGYMLLADVKWD